MSTVVTKNKSTVLRQCLFCATANIADAPPTHAYFKKRKKKKKIGTML